MSWELLDWTIVGPALVAGLIVLSTHVPLGHEVLKRGIWLIIVDDHRIRVGGLHCLDDYPQRARLDGYSTVTRELFKTELDIRRGQVIPVVELYPLADL